MIVLLVVVAGIPARNYPILDGMAAAPVIKTFPITTSSMRSGLIPDCLTTSCKTGLSIASIPVDAYGPLFPLVIAVRA